MISSDFQGGPNADILEFDGIKHVLHTIPSEYFIKDQLMLLEWSSYRSCNFEKELRIDNLDVEMSELLISKKAHLILPTHKLLDGPKKLKEKTK